MLEIVVAISILGIVMSAAGPAMLQAITAGGRAKLVSQAKGIVQGQLDAMRTMPFRVAPSSGDHLDLLDTYYQNLAEPRTAPVCAPAGSSVPPAASWSGYVPAASSARCAYEPGSALYRRVIAPGTGGLPSGFALVVDTQFVSAGTVPAVLVPPAAYDTQAPGRDRAPSSQVGVTATVLYSDHGRWYPFTVYTQMSAPMATEARIRLEARATTVEIGSTSSAGDALSLTGGQLALAGSLANAAQARASLAAISGAGGLVGRRSGASIAVDAPYTEPGFTIGPADGLGIGCDAPCWGSTSLPPFTVLADAGLPRVGVGGPTGLLDPVHTLLADNQTRDGFQFRTGTTTLPDLTGPLVSMGATPPPGSTIPNLADGLFHCAYSIPGPNSHLSAAGYLNSTDELATATPNSVEACAGGRVNVIRLLPTTAAPNGLVRITARSSARCTVSGMEHLPTISQDYRADVEYWRWTPTTLDAQGSIQPGHGDYVQAGSITPAVVVDPLASVPLTAAVSDTATLGDYFESWSGLMPSSVQTTVAGHVAAVTVPALVTLQTKPVRAGEPASAISLSVGAAACRAEDNR